MRNVEIFENDRASNYNQFAENWILNYHYFLDCLPRLLKETNSKDLLVVGCGTGNEIEKFVQASEHWNITGIDPSPEMIIQAREKLKSYENVTLIEGLVTDLAIEKKYEAATLILVLHFLDDNGSKLNLLKDIAGRLVSGATLIMLDITVDKTQNKQNFEIYRLLLPGNLNDEEISKRLHRMENELYLVSEKRIEELCAEAGFEKPLRFFQSSVYMGWLTKKK